MRSEHGASGGAPAGWGRGLAVSALVALAACARPAAPPNVVVVLVDTLRQDRLGVYGDPHGLTPSIDALASRGTVFRNAYAQSSWTLPSVASLFTSRFASQHHVLSFSSQLDEREDTLAEILHARGYATAAFVANLMLLEQLGLGRGFDVWQVVFGRRPAAPPDKPFLLRAPGAAVDRAVFEWLDGRTGPRQPVFLYVHYMDPHPPYDPPENVLAARLAGAPPPDRAAVNRYALRPAKQLPDALLSDAVALYDAEVASVDAAIGQLLDGLRQRGVLDDAIVVLLADHGEELKEHGLIGHRETLYEEVIRVPLIIVTSARPAHREVDSPVSVIDVAPTVLELIGGTVPAQFEGRSRARTIGARPWWEAFWPSRPEDDARPIFSELIKPAGMARLSPHERAVVSNGMKLITGVDGTRAYYALGADPGEHDPNGVPPGQRAALDGALAGLQATAPSGTSPTAPALDDETREHMRALGYAD